MKTSVLFPSSSKFKTREIQPSLTTAHNTPLRVRAKWDIHTITILVRMQPHDVNKLRTNTQKSVDKRG